MNSEKKKQAIEAKLSRLKFFENEEDRLTYEAERISLRVVSLINTLCQKNNFNKKDLAQKLKVSQSYISQISTGEKLVNLKLFGKSSTCIWCKGHVGLKYFSKYRNVSKGRS